MPAAAAIIDDLRHGPPLATIGSHWQLLTDGVMGGISRGTMTRDIVDGRAAICLQGVVSLENNGGLLQIALDLSADGGVIDASIWDGIELDIRGDGEEYGVHLRTDALSRPWQSYRHLFTAAPAWHTIRLPLADFTAHRTDQPFDPRRLRRLGVVAIGRAFSCHLALGGVRFMAKPPAPQAASR